MKSNFNLAVVGNVTSVSLFLALGCQVFGVLSTEEAEEKTLDLFQQDQGDEAKTAVFAIIFIEEDFYKDFQSDLIERFTNKPLPAIIPIPSLNSSDPNFALKRLSRIVEKAVGSDILS